MTGTWLRRTALLLLALVLGLAALTGRMVRDGEREMLQSDEAFDRGDVSTALLHARRAAVLYAPGAGHVSRAYARLLAIARGAEASGDVGLARDAWRAVRGAALETRHFRQVRAEELALANGHLARLSQPAGAGGAPAAVSAELGAAPPAPGPLAELERDDTPEPPWAAALTGGFLLVLLALGLLAGRAVDAAGRVRRRPLLVSAALGVVGLSLWAMALLYA